MLKELLDSHSNGDDMDREGSTVRIISSTCPDLHNGPSNVADVLSACCSRFCSYRTLVQVINSEPFLIWTQEVLESASWGFVEACNHIESRLIQQSTEAFVVLFNFSDSADEKPAKVKTCMVSILSLRSEAAKSIHIPYYDRQALEEGLFENIGHRSRSHRSKFHRVCIRKNLAFVIAGLILVLMGIALIATSFMRPASPRANIWLSWNLPKDSKGPRNQLQFTWPHPNFTTWSAENDRSIDDFYLRLDDQTMIPIEYVDDYELQYQDWYAKNYPWFAEIGDSKAYLNESYWRDTRSYPLAIDHEFHVAHCVLTMKRYWKARESNHHVCPRDIDHNHISHCFGVLESYAFNGFETHHRMDPQVNGTSLMWIVNACF